jgi:glycosyltransferase involved in cell wall biosynthesis
MRILLIIDDLGSGGAQRQLVNLAKGLKFQHEKVGIFIYNPAGNFFISEVLKSKIEIHVTDYNKGFSFKTIYSLYKIIIRHKYTHIISFLDTPNFYAEITSLFLPKIKVLVSERSSRLHENNLFFSFIKRLFHLRAKYVIANSHSHAVWLKKFIWLKNKIKVVYNGYDFHVYNSYNNHRYNLNNLLVVGRISKEKNGLNLIKALDLFHKKRGFSPKLNWVGRVDNSKNKESYYFKMQNELERLPHVKSNWNWLGERHDITNLLNNHKALILASFYEGLPNVICEAFSCGLPVIASNVCDNPFLVSSNKRGFLFDPNDINEIEEAIWKIVTMESFDWISMSKNAVEYSHLKLDIRTMTNSYQNLLNS